MSNEDLEQRVWELEQKVERLEAALATSSEWRIRKAGESPGRTFPPPEYELDTTALHRALADGH